MSPTGSDSYPGTLEKPFKTIQKGCDVLKPGDTLYLKEGLYNEKIVLNSAGAEHAPITIQPLGLDRVIVDGRGIKDRSAIFYIENKSYITIKGLELCNSRDGDPPAGIMIEGYGSGLKILHNKIHDIESSSNAHGIAAYGTNGVKPIRDLTIEGNEVYNCKLGSSESVVVNGNVENFRIAGNVIYDNDNIGIDCIGFEMTAPKNDQARSGLVTNNTVYNISSGENPAYGGDACAAGIYVDGGRDIVIEKNIVHNCDIGIEVASEHYGKAATGVLVHHNLIYFSGLYGFSLGGADKENGSAESCVFYNNTLYNNRVGINIQQAGGNKIYNNIVFDCLTLLEGVAGSNTLSYNLWYSPGGNRQGLARFGNPRFVSLEQLDFRLDEGSPAIDAGDPGYVAADGETDFQGHPRIWNGIIDCGAYEYSGME